MRNSGRSGQIARIVAAALTLIIGQRAQGAPGAKVTLLNVSYDVSREFYQEFNTLFAAHWKSKTGELLTINQSHGGSSKQARAVLDGLDADVVTMNQPLNIAVLHNKGGLIPANWAARLPNHSVPYTSTILFVVRRGNPKKIKDWEDLIRPEVTVVVPSPKTSGNGRYSYLAAWGYALRKAGDDTGKAREFVTKLFAAVPVLDTGGRGATTTFAEREIGDVLLTFESEVALLQKERATDQFEVIVPSASIIAENPVVWVDKVVTRRGTEAQAQAYLEYLYSDPSQELAAKFHFRPQNPRILAKHNDQFPALELFTVAEIAGSWPQAQAIHFAEGGEFDKIFQALQNRH